MYHYSHFLFVWRRVRRTLSLPMMMFFYLVTTGWIFYISLLLCGESSQSINQSINQSVVCDYLVIVKLHITVVQSSCVIILLLVVDIYAPCV